MPTTAFSFVAHPSGNEKWRVVDEFLSDVADIEPNWRVGATVLLARNTESTSRKHADAFEENALFVVADPETQRLELPFPSRGSGRNHHDYLRQSSPRANVARFVEDVLQAQVSNGRSILLSPWLVHGATPNLRNLRATVAFANEASSSPLLEDRDLWFGFHVTHNVLSDVNLRNAFLDELVELPENPIYLRTQVEAPDGPRQVSDRAVISGLREVVASLSENGRPVILAQSGLLGWLMMPFGAVAFGAGSRTAMQRTTAPVKNGFARQPLNWFFVPQFLGYALAHEMPQIAAVRGYQPCQCPYCDSNLPATGDDFDRESAGKHFLWWCALLANEMNAGQPDQVLQQRITGARSFWSQVQASSVPLDRRSSPLHLEDWLAATS